MADVEGFRRAAVLGTGQMGPGIAMLLAHGGIDTVLVSRSTAGAEHGLQQAVGLVQFWCDQQLTDAAAARATVRRLSASCARAEAVHQADLVIESVVEDLAVKQTLFATLERETRSDTLLCTNTSGLRITDIAAALERPQRALTTHFWNPPHLVPLVEIVLGERSDPAQAERLRALLRRCGKRPVVGRRDVPGQLGNRLQHAVIREALAMLEQGIASAEDIETALQAGPGARWPVYGVFTHNDMVGLDLTRAVQAAVLPSLAANATPAALLDQKIAAGELGVKTGQGHYHWTPERADAVRRHRDMFLVQQLRAASPFGRSDDAP